MLNRKCAGQSIAEYAVVIGLVIAAVVAMQIYVKRGLQAKIRDGSDIEVKNDTKGDKNIDYGLNDYQKNGFEPSSQNLSLVVSSRNASETVVVSAGGAVSKTTNESSSREGGTQTVQSVAEAGETK